MVVRSGKLLRAIFAFAIVSAMTGCWDSGEPAASTAETPVAPLPPTASTAEGVYGGTLTGAYDDNFALLVLENGDFWSVRGFVGGGNFYASGVTRGNGTSNNGTFTAANATDFRSGTASVVPVNATYDTVAKTITGTIDTTETFSGGPIAGFDYNTPASLTTIAGDWSVQDALEYSFSITIHPDGDLSGSGSSGCTLNGTLAPHGNGKNVFSANMLFGASCGATWSNLSAAGVALAYPSGGGLTQLLIAVTDSANQNARVFFGTGPGLN